MGRSTVMIRPDCGLLANLARLSSDVVPLAMQIMDDSATREEQQAFADRPIELGTRLNHRAEHTWVVIDSDAASHAAWHHVFSRIKDCFQVNWI